MVMVPVLAAPLLAATLYATVPVPVPLLPDVIVTHETLPVAVQVQELEDGVTVIVPLLLAALYS
jgi:hypothetical protein